MEIFSIWYILKVIAQLGMIHRMVQMDITAKNKKVEMEMWVRKDGRAIGRADLVDAQGKVWEVKHGGKRGKNYDCYCTSSS